MGKSRIILAAIALRKLFYGTNYFTVVFTSELLKSVDASSYELAATALGIQLNMIAYRHDKTLSSQIRSDTDYVVIDEADRILLDFHESLPNAHVLALSATPYAASKIEEKDYLDR